MDRLDGMVTLVTGGSRGIGAAICLEFARRGARVALTYANQAASAQQVVSAILAGGGEAFACQTDVRDTEQVEALLRTVLERWQRLDVLVNNAGVVEDNLLLTMHDQEWQDVLEVNLSGMFRASRAAARTMLLQRSGCIINLSSISASRPGRGQANYAASKGGVESFTRAMAAELGRKNIRINAIAPGIIETEMSARVREAAADEIKQHIALRRFGKPAEVAAVAAFLASPAAAYITGEVIHVDGGMAR